MGSPCMGRDVKPENVLLDAPRTTARLADFGSARVVAQGGGPYTGGCMTGWYRAPEVMLGDPDYGAALHAPDSWAAGCVVVEMANLAPAFPADTEVSAARGAGE